MRKTLLAGVALLALTACTPNEWLQQIQQPATEPASAAEGTVHRVAWTYDGDTVQLDDGTRVRLIGIDTPEVPHGDLPAEPCAWSAKRQMFAFGANPVRVVVGEGTTLDPYGRTLGYLFTLDGTFINEAIVRAGNAELMFFPGQHNTRYNDRLTAALVYAQAHPNDSCLW